MLAKFALLFLLAYFLEPADIALYGLIVVTIAYATYALGFDFYTYSTRELLGKKPDQWARLLRDQSVFFIVTYIVVLPLLALIFFLGFIPWSVAPWFFILLVLEHLAQELNRLLVAMSRQLYASVVHFLRSGLWALIVAVLFWVFPSVRSIEFALSAWGVGVATACCVGGLVIFKLDRACLWQTIDWQWVRRGVKVALPFLVATLAIRGLFTLDRYWVEALSGADVLAAYVLFAGVANAVTAFLDAGVFVFLYPGLIKAFKEKDATSFKSGMKVLIRQTLIISLLLSISAALLIHPVLFFIGKEVYVEHVGLLYVLLVAIVLYALSMVPHYGLYAMSQDRSIIISHLVSLVVFVAIAALMTRILPVYGVPLALCGSFVIMLVHKSMAYIKLKKKQSWIQEGKVSLEIADI
ncbi:Membrane protein involved in the export of O-antigen and teichoic acid [Halomonas saccharevitans]|uniref:Membrane protein involved in the export of O-antigen and teichoic acid n=1 Tax=Halomonas saccharevitans TaxID=416872 RepID=A0A1I7B474_9GAMM|nr:Membrane protein involved in the export of O-antigen and teichoic acid [Halomonas saccharevitans]